MANKTQAPSTWHRYTSQIIIALVALLIAAASWATFEATKDHDSLPTKSKMAYIDSNDAVDQVSNFYRQYLDNAAKPDIQKELVGAYGSQNLVFYNDYYQHGFNPITCSIDTPTNVTATLVSTGPVATVKALATYPDHSTATITAKVTLTDALKIDSITCPGTKGNLPPVSAN